MKVRTLVYSVALCAALLNSAYAETATEADPALYIAAFNATCRQNFPDMHAVALTAAANGRKETTPRLISGNVPLRMPRVFNKDGLMLTMTDGAIPEYSATCQITGSARTSLSGAGVAAIVSSAMGMGEPQLGPGNSKRNDFARWDQGDGITVQAGVAVYNKRVRTISISIRKAR